MTTAMLASPSPAILSQVESVTPTSRLTDDALAWRGPMPADPWEKDPRALEEIGRLEDDWDGDGAGAPSQDLVDSARELLLWLRQQKIPAPSRVAAGPNGTILLEWQCGLNYFEIEVCAPYQVEWMMALPGQPTRHGQSLDRQALHLLMLTLSICCRRGPA